ncbi:YdcF family protein [Chryseobacterium sp. ISL-6]|nr:YdcF family protein [Chryseobacterium sp. ISL-6]
MYAASVPLLWIIITANGFLGKQLAGSLQKAPASNISISSPSVIVVLGGGIVGLKEAEQPNIISYSRLTATAKLYHNAIENRMPCTILVSGKGSGRCTSEASLYTQAFVSMGIPESDIIQEGESMNTYENAKYSSRIIKKLPPSTIYLVTSGFQSKRAELLLKTMGIQAVPHPSDLINTEITITPNAYNCAMTSIMLTECIGIAQVELYNKLGLNHY